jgi:hypothetical protein
MFAVINKPNGWILQACSMFTLQLLCNDLLVCLALGFHQSELLINTPKCQPQYKYVESKLSIRKLISEEIKLLEEELI